MKKMIRITLLTLVTLLVIIYIGVRLFLPDFIDRKQNTYPPHASAGYHVSEQANTLHQSLTIMDWHADTLMWNRNLLVAHDHGHVDLPKMHLGNVALQMFTTVTKAPNHLNFERNEATSDNITKLAIVEGWPINTWASLKQRALYQAEKLHEFADKSQGKLHFITSKNDLETVLTGRTEGKDITGALLGMEGAHPLEGNLDNIDVMWDAGYRMIGLTHFFDNELGSSLHGVDQAGLTDFGREAVVKMRKKGIIIDLAHFSEQGVAEVLSFIDGGIVVSHTGFEGHCPGPRNIDDSLMKAIAAKGGLIGIGYWKPAACGDTPAAIASSIKYGIELIGADHVALGADWDGSVEAISADKIAAITQALLDLNVSEDNIRQVMGGSSVAFLRKWLPQ